MKIHFNGAARTVTGSQYLIETEHARVLMECGLFQGRREESNQRNLNFRFDPRRLDAVLLSHAHIDHSGNLPNLVKQGYEGQVHATSATVDLSRVMLLDSGHIQEADALFINKRRARRNEPPIQPLYTQEDAARVAEHFAAHALNQPAEIAPGIRAEFIEAGHILGSAAIRLEIEEGGRTHSLWFSGDIGRYKLPILRDPVLPSDADALMMECTYGDESHEDVELAHAKFHQVVLRTLQRGGKVIIPAFAVGRTQELVYSLNLLVADGKITGVPVYVDSPLAVNATRVFMDHPECYDQETHTFIREERHPALNFPGLTYIRDVEESKKLNDMKGPMVIISASGMAESGRILHHLKNNIGDPKNTVAIVSWQAPYTLGRRITERQPVVKIFGEEYPLRAEVATISGLSAHAGQDLLETYARAMQGRVSRIFLVHGEQEAAAALQEKLAGSGLPLPVYPELGDALDL